jgi:hypothetical protein
MTEMVMTIQALLLQAMAMIGKRNKTLTTTHSKTIVFTLLLSSYINLFLFYR